MKAAKFFGVVLICTGCIMAFVGIAAAVLPMIQNDQLKLVLSSFETASGNLVVNTMNNAMTFALNHCYTVLAAGVGIVLLGAVCHMYAARSHEKPQMRWERAGAASQPGAPIGTVPRWHSSKAESEEVSNPFASIGAARKRAVSEKSPVLPREPQRTFAPAAQSEASPYVRPGQAEAASPYVRPGQADAASPYARPGQADAASPYVRPGQADAASPYVRPGQEQVEQQAFQPPYREREAGAQPPIGQKEIIPQTDAASQAEAVQPAVTDVPPARRPFFQPTAAPAAPSAVPELKPAAAPPVAAHAKPALTGGTVSRGPAAGIENSSMAALLRKPAAKGGKATVVLSGFKTPAAAESAVVPPISDELPDAFIPPMADEPAMSAPPAPPSPPSPPSAAAGSAAPAVSPAPRKPRIKSTIGMHH